MCRANFFGFFDSYSCLIPTHFWGWIPPLAWVSWWVGWDGVIWDDFCSWICPIAVGDMGWPFSFTFVLSFAQLDAF